ncbi:hypothetical protein VCRA2128O305_80013 [Vibrio crassostreae]|nr:hypothetical protein VCRA2110O172_100013 [Vibrio crassostreae]CAK1733325.1 hypothetical protein VCRA2113O119_120072 [Vibrio crassostreae]CAK1839962.1 hypothetical protein VCRA2113O120_10071 [Vibrio crassostreae]CAK2175841.1 hypothetical protein VCRA2112O187_6820001 [Vibrio crassostreae]CAK2708442.1 hypothetical protein VCRA2119O124_10073 [Vibrio crassostreae]
MCAISGISLFILLVPTVSIPKYRSYLEDIWSAEVPSYKQRAYRA